MKWLGPLARLIQWLGTTVLGWKLARDRQKLKNAKAKVKALEAKQEVAELTDDEVAAELSQWQK